MSLSTKKKASPGTVLLTGTGGSQLELQKMSGHPWSPRGGPQYEREDRCGPFDLKGMELLKGIGSKLRPRVDSMSRFLEGRRRV